MSIKKRLEYLRRQKRAEVLSYGDIAELQSLARYIEPGDVELQEAAGIPEGMAPRFKHDCDQCVCLGRHGDADLYYCPKGPTVIARYSDEGSDYVSGMASSLPDLIEAEKRFQQASQPPDVMVIPEREITDPDHLEFLRGLFDDVRNNTRKV